MTLNRYLLSSFWVCLGHYLATFFLHIDGPMRSSSTAQAVFTMSLWLISCWVFVFVFYLLDLNRAEGKLPWFIARFKLAAATTVVPGYIKLPATTLYSFGQMAYVTLRNELLAYVLCVALWIKFDLCVAPSPLHILLSQRLGLPPLLESFVANAVYFVFYDTVFYIGHRLMHMKQFNLYAITHELHHLSFADAGVSHHFMGIIDFFLEVIIPVAVPVLVCGFHAPTLSSFVVMGAWNGVVVHSGYVCRHAYVLLLCVSIPSSISRECSFHFGAVVFHCAPILSRRVGSHQISACLFPSFSSLSLPPSLTVAAAAPTARP